MKTNPLHVTVYWIHVSSRKCQELASDQFWTEQLSPPYVPPTSTYSMHLDPFSPAVYLGHPGILSPSVLDPTPELGTVRARCAEPSSSVVAMNLDDTKSLLTYLPAQTDISEPRLGGSSVFVPPRPCLSMVDIWPRTEPSTPPSEAWLKTVLLGWLPALGGISPNPKLLLSLVLVRRSLQTWRESTFDRHPPTRHQPPPGTTSSEIFVGPDTLTKIQRVAYCGTLPCSSLPQWVLVPPPFFQLWIPDALQYKCCRVPLPPGKWVRTTGMSIFAWSWRAWQCILDFLS